MLKDLPFLQTERSACAPQDFARAMASSKVTLNDLMRSWFWKTRHRHWGSSATACFKGIQHVAGGFDSFRYGLHGMSCWMHWSESPPLPPPFPLPAWSSWTIKSFRERVPEKREEEKMMKKMKGIVFIGIFYFIFFVEERCPKRID